MIQGVGTDIIEISRIQKAIERWGDDFIHHVFTAPEIDYARKHKFPYPHFAGRFAAKEALFKALGDRSISWKDLTIVNDPDGKPICLSDKISAHSQVFLSISHSRDYATAVAIVGTLKGN